jgi:hypothetical protein
MSPSANIKRLQNAIRDRVSKYFVIITTVTGHRGSCSRESCPEKIHAHHGLSGI